LAKGLVEGGMKGRIRCQHAESIIADIDGVINSVVVDDEVASSLAALHVSVEK
jgi:hypothetical protein